MCFTSNYKKPSLVVGYWSLAKALAVKFRRIAYSDVANSVMKVLPTANDERPTTVSHSIPDPIGSYLYFFPSQKMAAVI